ncbi:hypothetical protein A5696_12645 [Mycobacterium sp. E2699]|nr:hypothetical protein A5696_12645 [Mycobacterium sp. E2699]OBI49224.1 hypothetical protein A5705_14115 [Mycobacterium sp. E787]
MLDQAFYAGHCAVGQQEVMQILWLYERPIDFDGLRRFHHNLGHGLLARLIERSPLPFGRHRWVLDRGPADIDIAERARPRAELSDWTDERSQRPVDPEAGPGWHLGVLPLTDGSTAVTLVASHYVLDGIGLLIAAIEAMLGQTRELGYPPPRSRGRLRAAAEDARQTARDLPDAARAMIAFARLSRRQRRDTARPALARRPVTPRGDGGGDPVILPGASILVDVDHWNARAQALGGSSNTLAAGLTAKLAEHLGRRRGDDGAVTLQVVKSDRTEGDTRAVAVSFARVTIDPTRVTTDLREARAAIKQALQDLREAPGLSSQLAALTPFTPKRTWRRGVDAALNDPDLPVVCSHLGDVGFSVGLLDGTHCDYAWARGTRQHVTRQWLERTGGHLQVLSFSSPGLGKVCIHVVTYQPGVVTTKPALRELAQRTLAEFELTGQID